MTAALAPGAVPDIGGNTRFTVWAPARHTVTLCLSGPDRTVDLPALGGGYFGDLVPRCGAGARYTYRLDGEGPYADPASRSQPEGVHGPSEVIDLRSHQWNDAAHRTRPLWQHVISEVHIGTLSADGTFDGAIAALEELVEVGISAVEIMPVAQFPGRRNWGYDGVFPFAVQNSYGGPRAFQRFVDRCHGLGMAVVLDVVYNHVGPEGNVLDGFGPYFTDRYHTPWGPAVNVDGPESDEVRRYLVSNALGWFEDFHVDGLRLDAVHGIVDTTARPFLLELAEATDELSRRTGRVRSLIAESADNDPRLVTERRQAGIGMHAQWNDDFHHALHVALTGETIGYYDDFEDSGAPNVLARAVAEGFVLQGQRSRFRRRRHGAPSGQVPPERFVVYAQNHDQVGNRPRGERLSATLDMEHLRLAAAVVLMAPGIPLIFMGEEYAEPAPFPFFVDHGHPELIEAVRTGRARELMELGFAPSPLDPADAGTFALARLDLGLRHAGCHARVWATYRGLLALRRAHPALGHPGAGDVRAGSPCPGVLQVERRSPGGSRRAVLTANFGDDECTVALPDPPAGGWRRLAHSRDPELGGAGRLPSDGSAPSSCSLAAAEFAVHGDAGGKQ
jgi:maltooligosyltrehalose trehalohydrolase